MSGDMETATMLLGRYPTVPGTVVPGSKRGHDLGFPTANLALPPNQALPADGVYATLVWRPSTGQMLRSVTSIGTRPTFDDDARLVEIQVVEGGPVLGVCHQLANGQLAQPAVLPEHFRKEVLIGSGAGRGHGSGDDPSGECQMRLVGEVAPELRSVDEGGLGIGSAHEFFIGSQRPA